MSSIAERPSRRKPNPQVEAVIALINRAIFDDPSRKRMTRDNRELRMGELWMAKTALKRYLRFAKA